MERVRYLVLGGGVTGLSFANFLDAKGLAEDFNRVPAQLPRDVCDAG
jgi:hypothetical protein